MRARAMRAAALTLALLAAPRAWAQEAETCPDGRAPVGKLGIEDLRCSSGHCLRGFAFEGGRLITTFTTEPRVQTLAPPADAVLEPGDVIVAVDGKLSTTREAAERLARVEPGDRVRLRIRRDGTEREVTITAIASCDRIRHRVFALDPEAQRRWSEAMERLGERFVGSFDWEGLSRAWEGVQVPLEGFDFEFDTLDFRFDMLRGVEPPFELGLELTCGFFCGWRKDEDGEPVWHGQHPPKVARVVEGGPADRAGLRASDVLLLLDGHSFVGEEGGRALGRLAPGRALTLQYLKGGETLATTTITPRPPVPR